MRRFDLELAQIYFGWQPMLMELGTHKFDIGIGGMSMADSLLFRHLKIPYVKISQEDLESFQMQVNLNIPIQTSYYPSS